MFIEKRTNPQQSTNTFLRMVNYPAVKDLKVEGFEYQTNVFQERSLMPSRYSVFRIIPGVSPDGRILGTYKEGADLSQATKDPASVLSDTFSCVTTIQPFGSQWSDTVLAAYPMGSDEEEQRLQLNKQSVLEKFTRVVQAAVDPKKRRSPLTPHDDWFRWTQFSGGTLGKVKYRLLMQGIIWVCSDKPSEVTLQDGSKVQKPIIALLSIDQKKSMDEFLQGVAAPMDIRRTPDPFTNSNLGPVAEANGIWCYVHPEKNNIGGEQDVRNYLVPRAYAQGGSPSDPPSEYPLTEDWIRSVWTPWDKLLKWYTMDEQFHLIAQTFGPDTVNYVFETIGDEYYTAFIPTDIKQKGFGRYQRLMKSGRAAMPATGSYGAVPTMPPTGHNAVPPTPPTHSTVPPVPSSKPSVTAPDMTADDKIPMDFMPKSANPKVQELMNEALISGVQVTGMPKLPKLPPIPGGVPSVPSLDDIQATTED